MEVAVELELLTRNNAGNLWLCRLNVFLVDAMVADERIGHRHDLLVVGRIAEYLVVTVSDVLNTTSPMTSPLALKDSPVSAIQFSNESFAIIVGRSVKGQVSIQQKRNSGVYCWFFTSMLECQRPRPALNAKPLAQHTCIRVNTYHAVFVEVLCICNINVSADLVNSHPI